MLRKFAESFALALALPILLIAVAVVWVAEWWSYGKHYQRGRPSHR